MTYSIVVRSGEKHGVGVCTAGPAVGAIVPFVGPSGAIATQSYYVSTRYGVKGLRLLEEGLSVDDAICGLLDTDDHSEMRQVHGVDSEGNQFGHTGTRCDDWAGHRFGESYSVAGNRLQSEEVLNAIAQVFENGTNLDISTRLVSALEAGQKAGGDKLGIGSAAIQVYSPEPKLHHDLRVDQHESPISELQRVCETVRERKADFEPSERTLGRW